MGERFAEGVILNLEATWEESDFKTPMIGLLSMGSDPTSAIEGLAKRHNIECRAISMGQGQEIHARRLLQQCSTGVSARFSMRRSVFLIIYLKWIDFRAD